MFHAVLMTAFKQNQDGTGQRSCPKHVEFYNKLNLDNSASGWLFEKKFVTMHGHMNVNEESSS
jgi:hypothetical protein